MNNCPSSSLQICLAGSVGPAGRERPRAQIKSTRPSSDSLLSSTALVRPHQPRPQTRPQRALFLNPSEAQFAWKGEASNISVVSLVQPNRPRPLQAIQPAPTAGEIIYSKCGTTSLAQAILYLHSTQLPAICGPPRPCPTRCSHPSIARGRTQVRTLQDCRGRRRASHESLPPFWRCSAPRSFVVDPASMDSQCCMRQSALFHLPSLPACLPTPTSAMQRQPEPLLLIQQPPPGTPSTNS